MERIPASERTREKLKAVIEGSSEGGGTSELVRLAARLIIEEALEGEARDALGRDYYARGAAPGAGYRNGYRTGQLRSAEGAIEYRAPQIADRREPFRSAIREIVRGRTAARGGAGGLGPPGGWQEGAAALGAGHQRGYRELPGILPRHAAPRLARSTVGDQRRGARHHPGARRVLPARAAAALSGAQDA